MWLLIFLYVSDLFYFKPEDYNSGLTLPLAFLLLFGVSLFIIRHRRIYRNN